MRIFFSIIVCLCFASYSELAAGYLFKNGKFIDTKDVATLSVEEHYNLGIKALEAKDWQEAVRQFRIVTINFPLSSWGQEGFYFLGVAYYQYGDMEMANNHLSTYLKENQAPQYYEETFRYKLAIADAFHQGSKKHMFGYEKLPQWVGGEDLAVSIYEEIVAALPNHEIAAKALLSQAALLGKKEKYKESVEAYQALIRKFAKSEFAAKGYAEIGRIYCEQARRDASNPDILPLAEINIKRFSQDFPRDPQIATCREYVAEMKEIFATSLYETGLFYERKNQPKASVLYYHTAITQFPDTKTGEKCRERIKALQVYANEIDLPPAP